ncbi:MAG: hypothetical protein RL134_2337 [Actinomycetota bacterium]|jgi:hypothetical protein
MAEPRSTQARGARVLGERGKPKPERVEPEDIADPTAPRRVVSYALQRRSVLRGLYGGQAFNGFDICDADPYLLRAARFHGVVTEELCPVCRVTEGRDKLTQVTYVYGEQLGHIAGSAIDPARLPDMAREYGEFRVYVVEVCTTCHWNHLVTSYVLGDGKPRKAPAKPRDLLD